MTVTIGERGRVVFGDAVERLRELPDGSVDCVVTSPPYWQLRDYGHEGQLGLEASPRAFVERLASVFDEVWRVLSPKGTCWVNLGDTYLAGKNGGIGASTLTSHRNHDAARKAWTATSERGTPRRVPGMRRKTLVGIPWRFALEMIDRGWILRADIVWKKPNALPESVRDRPSRSHEYVFLFSRSPRYFYDPDVLRTPLRPQTLTTHGRSLRVAGPETDKRNRAHGWAARAPKRQAKIGPDGKPMGANARSVWTIAQEPWDGEHTSTYPRELVRRCVLAGCPEGGLVFDPFAGTGTSVAVAVEYGRRGLGIELCESLAPEIERRFSGLQLAIPLASGGTR